MAVSAGQTIIAGKVPGERIATEEITSDSGTTTGSEIEVASVTAAVVNGRTYRVAVVGAIVSDTSGDRCQIHIREDDDEGTLVQNRNVHVQDTSAFGTHFHNEGEYTADATENKTFVVTLELNNGTGPVNLFAESLRPAYLYVDYIRG